MTRQNTSNVKDLLIFRAHFKVIIISASKELCLFNEILNYFFLFYIYEYLTSMYCWRHDIVFDVIVTLQFNCWTQSYDCDHKIMSKYQIFLHYLCSGLNIDPNATIHLFGIVFIFYYSISMRTLNKRFNILIPCGRNSTLHFRDLYISDFFEFLFLTKNIMTTGKDFCWLFKVYFLICPWMMATHTSKKVLKRNSVGDRNATRNTTRKFTMNCRNKKDTIKRSS